MYCRLLFCGVLLCLSSTKSITKKSNKTFLYRDQGSTQCYIIKKKKQQLQKQQVHGIHCILDNKCRKIMSDMATLPDTIPYKEIQKAQSRIAGKVFRIPLIPLNVEWEGGKVIFFFFGAGWG